ncbi:hypothetical protein M404DRAFT_7446 [Pisolithus tinctorius Marx 270]|uniref:Uncharacterized protein n=1 Tax=Pisolithus tinctorius Marx 270 TaxID=870435 RepID=A0A0C3KMP5_PISTI|nr:hypothetical protein M404DRAFT_7446 [Pisolithus tinctorius Marx 270]
MTVHSAPSKVDVLIIGAGPAGVMWANTLVPRRCKRSHRGPTSYGLGDRLLRKDCRVYMATFYEPSENGGIKLSRRAPDITAPSARYPFELALRQRAIESIFLDSMKTRGAEVQRSTRPIEIELSNDAAELADPTSYPVKVTLGRLSPNGTVHHEVVHAKFVLCADGAHSWVRNAFGIAMDLVLTGDFNAPIQTQKIQALEKSLEQPESFLNQYPRERVLLDDTDVSGTIGGKGYAYYGIPDEGALVVVRPDGYIVMITPLDGSGEINKYFARFMNA